MLRPALTVLLCAVFWVSSVTAGSLDNAKLALHVQPISIKGVCLEASQGGEAPDFTPCSQYAVQGQVNVSYSVYLVATGAIVAPGFTGISCGIDYDPVSGQGVEIFGWTRCSDLDFPTVGPNGVWPAAGGSNRITWASCQTATVPGFESEGAIAIAGAFYVYAYNADTLRVTSNKNLLEGPELAVTACDITQSDLPIEAAGFVAFSATGVPGCNPCLEPCPADPGACIVSPTSLTFNNVPVGGFADESFTITNDTPATLDGAVGLVACPDFVLIAGGGTYSLLPGANLEVTVRFLPSSGGSQSCTISTGTGCADVVCTGNTQDPCFVSPTALGFGTVEVGETASSSFLIRNNGSTEINGFISPLTPCADFAVTPNGPWTLAPGASLSVGVFFTPSAPGTQVCQLSIGTGCSDVFLNGEGAATGGQGRCITSISAISFGSVLVGDSSSQSFTIANTDTVGTSVTITENCASFSVSGPTTLFLDPGESKILTASFTPSSQGFRSCNLQLDPCGSIYLSGTGIVDPGPLNDAKLALHLKPVAQTKICDPAEVGGEAPTDVPCSDYRDFGTLNTGYSLYLVAFSQDFTNGIAGASFGIEYGPNMGVFGWELCADLDFPGNGWPASGGGNIVTWAASTNCQTNVAGEFFYGIFGVLGALYVYAYGDAEFTYVERSYVPNPDIKLANCVAAETDVLPFNRAMARFSPGGVLPGYNPCGLLVPVNLLSFSAERTETGAALRWEIDGTATDYSGFEIFRESPDGQRVFAGEAIPTRETAYTWNDPAPPYGETTYWLGARLRTGELEWVGSTLLPAGENFGRFVLRQNHPNPFRASTVFFFHTPTDGEVVLRIFDTAGREVGRPYAVHLPAGDHTVSWDGRDGLGTRLQAGIYFYRLESAAGTAGGKLVLLQ